jgi:hypothetical protein
VLESHEPQKRQAGEGETDDKTADGMAKTALRDGPDEDRQGREKEAKKEEKHASRIRVD